MFNTFLICYIQYFILSFYYTFWFIKRAAYLCSQSCILRLLFATRYWYFLYFCVYCISASLSCFSSRGFGLWGWSQRDRGRFIHSFFPFRSDLPFLLL